MELGRYWIVISSLYPILFLRRLFVYLPLFVHLGKIVLSICSISFPFLLFYCFKIFFSSFFICTIFHLAKYSRNVYVGMDGWDCLLFLLHLILLLLPPLIAPFYFLHFPLSPLLRPPISLTIPSFSILLIPYLYSFAFFFLSSFLFSHDFFLCLFFSSSSTFFFHFPLLHLLVCFLIRKSFIVFFYVHFFPLSLTCQYNIHHNLIILNEGLL